MMSVPPEDRAKKIKGLDLSIDKLPIERALGVHWCIESDAFKFRIELKDKWIRGSEFLWQTEDHWPRQGSYENEIQERFQEVKKVTANTTVIEEYESMLSRFERFSNWQGLKTAVALCMEYKRRLRMSISTSDEKTHLMKTLELTEGVVRPKVALPQALWFKTLNEQK